MLSPLTIKLFVVRGDPIERLACSRGLHPRVARARLRGKYYENCKKQSVGFRCYAGL